MNKKYVCLDTETTGLSSANDRIIEIGCVNIIDNSTYHQYINPERSISESAFKIHNLSLEFLSEYKTFKTYAPIFLNFIKDAVLIIHNASFDIGFLNAELVRNGFPELTNEVIDTVKLAKKILPGKKVNLNALMLHYNVNIPRNFHGALLDSQILAQVYKSMVTHQENLELKINKTIELNQINSKKIEISAEEIALNEEILKGL